MKQFRNSLSKSYCARPAGQKGGAAVEFAFVFPVMFLVMYGVVVYAYMFVLQESLNFAAQEAAESAVAVDPRRSVTPDYESVVDQRIRATAQGVLGWLPEAQKERVLGAEGSKVGVTFGTTADAPPTDTVTVTLNYELAGLFPVLDLYFVGEIPPMPSVLRAQAVIRL